MEKKKKNADLCELLLLPKAGSKEGKTVDYSKITDVIATAEKKVLFGATTAAVVGTWVCNPQNKNRLCWSNGDPVVAVEVHYAYDKIDWSAGVGWPRYHVPMPLNDHQEGFYYPGAPRHCIIWEFGGTYDIATGMQSGKRGSKATEVMVIVNDDQYGDNVGSITVSITAYSQS